jgi:hypothetical protein
MLTVTGKFIVFKKYANKREFTMKPESKRVILLTVLLMIGLTTGISPWLDITYKISKFLNEIYFFIWCWILALICSIFVIIKSIPLKYTTPKLKNLFIFLAILILISALSYGIFSWVIGTLVMNMPYG